MSRHYGGIINLLNPSNFTEANAKEHNKTVSDPIKEYIPTERGLLCRYDLWFDQKGTLMPITMITNYDGVVLRGNSLELALREMRETGMLQKILDRKNENLPTKLK